jgi:PTS system mannose-specific IID component
MARLEPGDRLRMALRAELIQATFNYERQQGLGWAFSLEPALDRLIPDAVARRERLAQHTAYFNTQPTLASLALGAVARLEEERIEAADGAPDDVARIKAVLGSALAALGDRLYWFTLRPLSAILGVLLASTGSWTGAVALWLCYNVFHQAVRLLGVGWGYREGPAVFGEGLRRRLERWTRLLAVLGAALVGITISAMLVPQGVARPLAFQAALAAGLGAGLVVSQRPRPSPTEWALGAGLLCVIAAFWTTTRS